MQGNMVMWSLTRLAVAPILAGALLLTANTGRAGSNPQSCADGYTLIKSADYEGSIRALTRCLKSRSVNTQSRSIAYYNRALSYYLQGYAVMEADTDRKRGKEIHGYYKNGKLIPGYFDKALEDVKESIKIDPANAADGYCLRGQIWLEISWGDVGYDDLDKGRAMGASQSKCQY